MQLRGIPSVKTAGVANGERKGGCQRAETSGSAYRVARHRNGTFVNARVNTADEEAD